MFPYLKQELRNTKTLLECVGQIQRELSILTWLLILLIAFLVYAVFQFYQLHVFHLDQS